MNPEYESSAASDRNVSERKPALDVDRKDLANSDQKADKTAGSILSKEGSSKEKGSDSIPAVRLHYVYIVQCQDGTLYTGYTTDLSRRIKTHNAGKGAKYTRARRPVHLVYHEAHISAHDARSREVGIKRLTRKEKLALVCSFQACLCELSSIFMENEASDPEARTAGR